MKLLEAAARGVAEAPLVEAPPEGDVAAPLVEPPAEGEAVAPLVEPAGDTVSLDRVLGADGRTVERTSKQSSPSSNREYPSQSAILITALSLVFVRHF